MVGLPARGKSLIARKISNYMNWIGVPTRVFSVASYRRERMGPRPWGDFFDPANQVHSLPPVCCLASHDWTAGSDEGAPAHGRRGAGRHARVATRRRRSRRHVRSSLCCFPPHSYKYVYVYGTPNLCADAECSYDGSNVTQERRRLVLRRCQAEHVQVVFVESIVDEPSLIDHNMRQVLAVLPVEGSRCGTLRRSRRSRRVRTTWARA